MLGEPGPRLMAVNADEGEPGTFKDRHFLETDPHRVLEGMLIAAHVVEAADIYFYLRDEYPRVPRDPAARDRQAGRGRTAGRRRVHLRRGAGAYICGEESAMIESIEGKRGLPRHKPPLPFQVGIFGRPTLINNVETLYWIRDLVERGPEWWTGQGRNGRKGLHVYSVSGRVADPGVKIAPAGVTVRELIDEFCGGMLPGHTFKAYVPGGPSSGILPASMGDIPLDFGTLEPHGSFIGSAAVVILSDKDSIKDAALNLMRFFMDESCGQCTPCRVGTEKAVKLMARARLGREAAERAVGRHARRLDLRPGPGGAQLGDLGHETFPADVGIVTMSTIKFTIDGVEVEGRDGRDDLADRQALRRRHPASLLLDRADLSRRRQLPRLHGRDRGRARAGRLLPAQADRRA